MTIGPPRMLLGAALLFWGGMTDRAFAGLLCALLVEGSHWTRIRWEFTDRATLIAWRLTVLLLFFAMVLVVLQGARLNAMGLVFTWLPVITLPLQFVQSYGMSKSMWLGTFSVMIRRRKEHALKYGLPFREVRFSFGYVFFCATLLASCLGTYARSPAFYPLLVLLVCWAFISTVGRGRCGVSISLLIALLLSSAGGIGGQKGLSSLYVYITKGRFDGNRGPSLDYLREIQTSIGNLGKLKQSPEIQWRLIPKGNHEDLPRLLRVASYSEYKWASNRWIVPGRRADEESESFQSPAQIVNPANPDDLEDEFIVLPPDLPDPKIVADSSHKRFRLRGSTPDEGLFPLPGNAVSLHGFSYEEFERNEYGTFRLKPSQPVADTEVLWSDGFATERPPLQLGILGNGERSRLIAELQIPNDEVPVIRQIVDELDLRSGDLESKLDRLRTFFLQEFSYSKYNSVPRDYDPRSGITLVGKFLTVDREGHCEYFATASALLLREVGIPTRYVTGFSVAEYDPSIKEALVRGTHAHAWCRAWDEANEQWLDVDMTPGSWTSLENAPSRYQKFTDWIQRKRENFLVWRDQPGHMPLVMGIVMLPLIVGLGFIGRSLWRSRSKVDGSRNRPRDPSTLPSTPLTGLEKPARRLLGERPAGMPLVPWLQQLIPTISKPHLLVEAMNLHHQLRFDPAAEDPAQASRLETLVAEIRTALKK